MAPDDPKTMCAQCGERAYVVENSTIYVVRGFKVECYGPCQAKHVGATRAAAIAEWDAANPKPVPVPCKECGKLPVITREGGKNDAYPWFCKCPSCPKSFRTYFQNVNEVRVIRRWNLRQEEGVIFV